MPFLCLYNPCCKNLPDQPMLPFQKFSVSHVKDMRMLCFVIQCALSFSLVIVGRIRLRYESLASLSVLLINVASYAFMTMPYCGQTHLVVSHLVIQQGTVQLVDQTDA